MGDRVCGPDSWDELTDLSDSAPRSVRWAQRDVRYSPDWTRWHYTEGNMLHTACGLPVIAFMADGSPQLDGLHKINCKRCLRIMEANTTTGGKDG